MSDGLISFLVQFAPIFIGMAIMLGIKSLRLYRSKVVIKADARMNGEHEKGLRLRGAARFMEDLPVSIEELGISSNSFDSVGAWRGYIGDSESLRESAFRRVVYDELIASGMLPQRRKGDCLTKFALAHLGILNLTDLCGPGQGSMRGVTGLRVFGTDKYELLDSIMTFGKPSGLLVPYAAGYTLELLQLNG